MSSTPSAYQTCAIILFPEFRQRLNSLDNQQIVWILLFIFHFGKVLFGAYIVSKFLCFVLYGFQWDILVCMRCYLPNYRFLYVHYHLGKSCVWTFVLRYFLHGFLNVDCTLSNHWQHFHAESLLLAIETISILILGNNIRLFQYSWKWCKLRVTMVSNPLQAHVHPEVEVHLLKNHSLTTYPYFWKRKHHSCG